MTWTRRRWLAVIGGGVIVAAGASTGTFLMSREPSKALQPWRDAGLSDDARRRALSYAILAPNAHNRQPWLVDLSEPDMIVLYRDLDRDLPQTDPNARQLTISLGCFLELLRMAAAEDELALDLDLYPEGENGAIANIRLKDGGTADPLFAHVLARRSCKEPFDERLVPEDLVQELQDYARIIDAPDQVGAIRDLTWQAWMVEAGTPRTHRESVDLMRFGKNEIEANPDGIDLGGPFLESLMLAGLLTRDAQLDPNSTAFAEGVSIYRTMLAATPAYAVITTADNSRKAQIDAGRQWLRLNLATTGLGLALHPVSQALQEYPEMAQHYARAHELLAEPGHTVQMLGRLGFGPDQPPSPRWPLETRIRHG